MRNTPCCCPPVFQPQIIGFRAIVNGVCGQSGMPVPTGLRFLQLSSIQNGGKDFLAALYIIYNIYYIQALPCQKRAQTMKRFANSYSDVPREALACFTHCQLFNGVSNP